MEYHGPSIDYHRLSWRIGATRDCYNCDEQYVCGHRCKRLFYTTDYEDELGADEDAVETSTELVLSLYAIVSIHTEDTAGSCLHQ